MISVLVSSYLGLCMPKDSFFMQSKNQHACAILIYKYDRIWTLNMTKQPQSVFVSVGLLVQHIYCCFFSLWIDWSIFYSTRSQVSTTCDIVCLKIICLYKKQREHHLLTYRYIVVKKIRRPWIGTGFGSPRWPLFSSSFLVNWIIYLVNSRQLVA